MGVFSEFNISLFAASLPMARGGLPPVSGPVATSQSRPKDFGSPHGSDGLLPAHRLTSGDCKEYPGLLAVEGDLRSMWPFLDCDLEVFDDQEDSGLDL